MSAIPDPEFTLTPSGNLRRRLFVSRTVQGTTIAAAGLAVVVLGILVAYVAYKGISVISWSFLTGTLPLPGGGPGGIGPALVGTLELVAIATVFSLPVGVLTALLLTEYGGPRTNANVRLLLDLMNGLPTIITGVFAFALLVATTGKESAIAGSFALAIVMAPLITRASLEALARVPPTLREAADALGIHHWRTVVGVILPTAAGGIATGTILSIARAAGETAPLLFTTTLYGQGYQLNPFQAVPNIPTLIFTLVEEGYPSSEAQAWGAAFVLLVTILVLNIGARVLLRRSQRKQGL